MKRIIITESQYKKLVRQRLHERVVFYNEEDKYDVTPDIDNFISTLDTNLIMKHNKDTFIEKIENGVVFLDMTKYNDEEKQTIKDIITYWIKSTNATDDVVDSYAYSTGVDWDYEDIVPIVTDDSDVADVEVNNDVANVEVNNDVAEIDYDPNKTYNRREYINLIKNIAISQMKKHKIPASITIAQAAIESGDGNSRLARKGKNHFGVKCGGSWGGETITATDDRPNECFRKYSKIEDSFEDHSKVLVNGSRYDNLFKLDIKDYKGWAKGLKDAGYATSPKYANTIISVIEDYKLYQYDTETKKSQLSIEDVPLKPSLGKRITKGSAARSTSLPQANRWGRPHHGYDIVGPYSKSVIVSNRKGTVTYVGKCGSYGNLVEIDHGNGIFSSYGHLKHIYVREGQDVTIGTPIGLEGATGGVTGRHLHFEERVPRPKGKKNRCGNGSPYNEVYGYNTVRPISVVDQYFYYQEGL